MRGISAPLGFPEAQHIVQGARPLSELWHVVNLRPNRHAQVFDGRRNTRCLPTEAEKFQRAALFQVEIDMKFAFKSIVVAAAFVAAGAASAATLTTGNTAQTVNGVYLVGGTGS